jgi:hypothetical protein
VVGVGLEPMTRDLQEFRLARIIAKALPTNHSRSSRPERDLVAHLELTMRDRDEEREERVARFR